MSHSTKKSSAKAPLILVTPSTERRGAEMEDHAISVGSRYLASLLEAGALPWVIPCTTDPAVLANAVERCDGVMLTGGDDINPELYRSETPQELLTKCEFAEPARDVMELEIFRQVTVQSKPLLAICRGHQLVNVALGGTLWLDLPSENQGPITHSQMKRKYEEVHEIEIEGPFLRSVWGQTRLGVNSTHHQAIRDLAPPLRVAARSVETGMSIVEATELAPGFENILPWFASVQFHPERLAHTHPIHARLFRAFTSACCHGV